HVDTGNANGSIILLFMLFFFSSRRRHTRFKCDWSSDVCSSDLIVESISVGVLAVDLNDRIESWNSQMEVMYALPRSEALGKPLRSEERRVGKESRYRWWRGAEQ